MNDSPFPSRDSRIRLLATAACLLLAFALPVQAAPEVCGDLAGEDGIKASDALILLKHSVGIEQDLACPSGVADVLSFDSLWSPASLPGNNGNTLLRPVPCRTTEYVARGNEVAVIAVAGTASPSQSAADVLYIEVLVSRDGGPFNLAMVAPAAESMMDGTAHASAVFALPLEVGIQYAFAAGFGSNQPLDISTGSCQGTVQILRPQP